MKILVTAFPMVAATVEVKENWESEEPLEVANVFYDGIVHEVQRFYDMYDVDSIAVLGPKIYASGITKLLEKYFEHIEEFYLESKKGNEDGE